MSKKWLLPECYNTPLFKMFQIYWFANCGPEINKAALSTLTHPFLMTASLPLLSGVVISAERHAYNKIRVKYAAVAQQHAVSFLDNYSATFKNIEDVHNNMQVVVQERLFRVTDEAIRDLIAHGIHDIDDSSFIGDHMTEALAHWQERFDQIDDQYVVIVMKQEELDAHRTSRRQERSRMHGFSLEGHAKAAAFNITSNLFHGGFNAMMKGGSMVMDLSKKDAIYKSESNRLALANALYDLLFYIHLAMIDLIHARCGERRYEYLTQDACDRAERLLTNVQKGRMPADAVKPALVESLSLNPYNAEAYKTWFDNFGDRDNSVASMARYFGIDSLDEAKRALVEKKAAGLTFDSAEDTERSVRTLEEYADGIGFTDLEPLKESLRNKAQRLDESKRTHNDVVYASADEARDAQARTVKNVTYATHEEAQVERSRKKVGILLGIGILLMPYVFSWFTLRKGYSALARALALGYMTLILYAVLEDRITGKYSPDTPVAEASAPAIPASAPAQDTQAVAAQDVAPPATPVAEPTIVDVPFIGKRTFNFDGGNGTQRTAEIDPHAIVRVHYVGSTSSSLDYEGPFTNPLPLTDGSALKFENGQVYLLRDGVVETGCMAENQPCVSELYE